MGRAKLTAEDHDRMLILHQQGIARADIANVFGVHVNTIGNCLRKHGYTTIRVIPTIPEPLKLAYYAGVFDGEGHITIGASKRSNATINYWLQIGIVNTYLSLLKDLQRDFGVGHLSQLYGPMKKANHLPAMCWRCTSNQAMYVLEAMLPFLRMKHEVAQVAIEFQRQSSTNRDQEWKLAMKRKVMALNALS
jgi:hypothetical protein